MIKAYRKTATIKAEQFDGSDEMIDKYHIETVEGDYAKDCSMPEAGPAPYVRYFLTRFDVDKGISAGDWIATGVNGEYWTISNDVFKKTYAELPVISEKLDSYIQLYKRNNYGITDMLYDLTDEVCPDANLTKNDIARAWLDGYQVEGHK